MKSDFNNDMTNKRKRTTMETVVREEELRRSQHDHLISYQWLPEKSSSATSQPSILKCEPYIAQGQHGIRGVQGFFPDRDSQTMSRGTFIFQGWTDFDQGTGSGSLVGHWYDELPNSVKERVHSLGLHPLVEGINQSAIDAPLMQALAEKCTISGLLVSGKNIIYDKIIHRKDETMNQIGRGATTFMSQHHNNNWRPMESVGDLGYRILPLSPRN
ncbi:hypothetical protein CsatB_019400 [Cannabis sativa]